MKTEPKKLIDLDQVKLPLPKALNQFVLDVSKPLLGVSTLNKYYDELEVKDNFYKSTLAKLDVTYDISTLEDLPAEGGVVIIANHPFGAIEGVILGDYLKKVRPDFKFIGNGLLQMIEEMKEDVIAVNPFGSKTSVGGNARGLREAIRWVQQGHVLVVFPAGEVSSLRLRHFKVEDPKWSKHIGWLIEKTAAPVFPLFFKGCNSAKFQSLGLVHPLLRTIMLPRELLNKSGKCIEIQAGRLIQHKTYNTFKDAQDLINYFRHQIYSLARKEDLKIDAVPKSQDAFEAIVEARSEGLIKAEVAQLDEQYHMLNRGKFSVYAAPKHVIPNVTFEIGRLREITFRGAGEGTGKSIDLDRFDEYYTHLFLWDKHEEVLVGAYRIGHTKEIIDQYGPQGMYSSTLFKIKKPNWDILNSGLEMGRSFVRAEYQKSPMCLPLLWHGISQYLMRNPPYHSLYGCVSICSDYQKSSVDLMIDYLRKFRPAPEGVGVVKPRTKHVKRQRHLRDWLNGLDPSNMNPEQLSQMISMLEPDGKGIPVLLRQYLKAGAKILSFNVDPDFSDVVDALVFVDLNKTDSKLLEKFVKRAEVAKLSKDSQSDNLNLA